MTPNKRIFLNVVATYGRSLYALVIGLFTSRWVLSALGQVDYGLFGVVGGLTVFVGFLNALMASAVGRFYAVSVGAAMSDPQDGLERCREWFTTAVVIHTTLPIVLVSIGYPIGAWAVKSFLSIPVERVEDCVWVWRFACLACFVGMVNIPFQAMYTAKQEIAELTAYSFATTTLNACFLYYIVSHPGVWLAKYSLWMCLMSVLPQLIICIRASIVYPECRVRYKYICCWNRIRELIHYAGWQAFGSLGGVLRGQGLAILINKFFGPQVNAASTIGTALSSHCNSLSGSMIGAFAPAIMNAYGAGRIDEMRKLSYRICKIGTVLIMVFSIPLLLEVDEVLRVWLKNPPQYAAGRCICVIVTNIIDKTAVGHMIAVSACGRIATYQAFLGGALILTLPLAWILVVMGCGVYSVGWAMIATIAICAWGRVWFARTLVGLSARYWLIHVLVPIFILFFVCIGIGSVPRLFFTPSLVRIILTTAMVESVLLPMSFCLILDAEEREFIIKSFRRVLNCSNEALPDCHSKVFNTKP